MCSGQPNIYIYTCIYNALTLGLFHALNCVVLSCSCNTRSASPLPAVFSRETQICTFNARW